jgi:hypothetical protein
MVSGEMVIGCFDTWAALLSILGDSRVRIGIDNANLAISAFAASRLDATILAQNRGRT